MWAPASSSATAPMAPPPIPSLRRGSQSDGSNAQHGQNVRRPSLTSEKRQEVAARSEEIRQHRLEEADASLPSMFQKLRRNSKQIFHTPGGSSKRSNSIAGDSPASNMEYLKLGQGKLTFLDLPPELRNAIYEDVARGTSLYVSCTSAKKKEKESKNPPRTTPALILASKQVRMEYIPLLLECASISFAVRDFDFRNLMRVSSSLYSSELKALRNNQQLTVRLLATKASKDSVASIRRWAQRRTEGMYTLPWHYSLAWPRQTQLVPTSTSVHRINTYIQRRGVLIQNLEALTTLGKEVPEAVQWELQPITEVFEKEMNGMNGSGSWGVGGRGGDPWGDQWAVPMFARRV